MNVFKNISLIQEKEKLYIKLKGIVARQSGVDMVESLKNYQKIIKETKEEEEGRSFYSLMFSDGIFVNSPKEEDIDKRKKIIPQTTL